jgi:peptidoglycan-associated lipoprotein
MNKTQALLTCLALALLVGCGDDSKKKTTTPSAPVVADTPAASDEPAAAESGPDPASLQATIYFEFDKSELDGAAKAKIEENAKWMKEDPNRVLTIEGHTDEVGTTDYNLALGERRARQTKEYLVALGVDANRIQIITYGEERPASNDDALNRRSMFIATKK